MRKPYTKKAFIPCIPDEQLKKYLTKREYTDFWKWMHGQTYVPGGVFWCDLERWLDGKQVID